MIMDTCRLTQQGKWSGKIKINDEQIDVTEDAFVGTRDRSWGVRPVGAYDSQPVVPFNMPQFYWLWAPFHLRIFLLIFTLSIKLMVLRHRPSNYARSRI